MNEREQVLEELKHNAAQQGKAPRTRRLLIILLVLWLITLATLIAVGWNAYFDKKAQVQTLKEQIAIACDRGTFGPPDFSEEDAEELCNNAERGGDDSVVIEGPRGPQGPAGVNGVDGKDGTDGKDGRNGRDGEDGDPGSNGQDGTNGLNGDSGAPGETGLAGPAGPPGPQGEQGPPGKDGTNGTNGTDGVNAIPFTFSFTLNQGPFSQTYICTISEVGTPGTCQEQE